MAQWCFLLARTSTGEKKQHGLTIFLVPMSAPGIEVRPIRTMLGPHHLNEVFFDGVRVTEADVLGTVDQGWRVVQEVLAFERVGIARYARCERLLLAAPRILGDQWEALPEELRGRWARMLVHCRRARLLAYRVISLQSAGTVTPGDAAAYRIAVTQLDQDSAEVLMEIVCLATPAGADGRWFRLEVEDHWRYSRASTVASGSIEIQRMLLARSLLKPAVLDRQSMNIELSGEALDYGRLARQALEEAGGDRLIQNAEEEPERRESHLRARARRARRVAARAQGRRR